MSEITIRPKQRARKKAKAATAFCKKAEEHLGMALQEAGVQLNFLQENRTAAQFHRIFMRHGLSVSTVAVLQAKDTWRSPRSVEREDFVITTAGNAKEAEEQIRALIRTHGFLSPATMVSFGAEGVSVWSLNTRTAEPHMIYDGKKESRTGTVFVDVVHRIGVVNYSQVPRFIMPGPKRDQ